MLFSSQRKMEPVLWDSIPNTTNAQESMHWQLYHAVEKHNDLMAGIYGVLAFLQLFERQLYATASKQTYSFSTWRVLTDHCSL